MARIVLLALFFYLSIVSASAGVVMLKTRIIYSSNSRFEILNLKNTGDIPYIMQIWTDVNNPNSTPNNADGPFIVQPTIFRIDPHTGRHVNLIFTGKNLPQDRESLFYLNLVQIAPDNSNLKSNRLAILIRHRIKIFYRPASLHSGIANAVKQIKFSDVTASGIKINNNSPYHLSLISLIAEGKSGQKVNFVPIMISPFSNKKIAIKSGDVANFKPINIVLSYINDLGGKVEHIYQY